MQSKRPEEFHIAIRWKPGYHGGTKFDGVPGFYVKAGWANEGEALYPIDDFRLAANDIEAICVILDRAFSMGDSLANAGSNLAKAHDAAAQAHTARLRTRVEILRKRLAEAEAAVSGIEHQA